MATQFAAENVVQYFGRSRLSIAAGDANYFYIGHLLAPMRRDEVTKGANRTFSEFLNFTRFSHSER